METPSRKIYFSFYKNEVAFYERTPQVKSSFPWTKTISCYCSKTQDKQNQGISLAWYLKLGTASRTKTQ